MVLFTLISIKLLAVVFLAALIGFLVFLRREASQGQPAPLAAGADRAGSAGNRLRRTSQVSFGFLSWLGAGFAVVLWACCISLPTVYQSPILQVALIVAGVLFGGHLYLVRVGHAARQPAGFHVQEPVAESTRPGHPPLPGRAARAPDEPAAAGTTVEPKCRPRRIPPRSRVRQVVTASPTERTLGLRVPSFVDAIDYERPWEEAYRQSARHPVAIAATGGDGTGRRAYVSASRPVLNRDWLNAGGDGGYTTNDAGDDAGDPPFTGETNEPPVDDCYEFPLGN